MKRLHVHEATLCAWLVLYPAFAGAASPDLQSCEPRGGQRGTEMEVKLVGNRLWDAEEIVFYREGITWKEVRPDEKAGTSVTVKFAIAGDAPFGLHPFRVRTKTGISYARPFWVSQFPNVLESENNHSFETPQDVALNVTIDGTVRAETADFFRFQAKKGQRVSVEVEGLRANSTRGYLGMDPYVAILNKDRFALASADDTPLLRQDCWVSVVIPEDGAYLVEVRDSAYEGRGRYRAHIGTFPRPTAAYPAGGQPGEELEVRMIGDAKGEYSVKVKLPAGSGRQEHELFASREGLFPPSPNILRLSPYPNVLEDESVNDAIGTLSASSGSLPLAFNGILQEDGDHDYFRFTAKKGQKFSFRTVARKMASPVDPVLHVFSADGKVLGGNDDADGSVDARYDFAAPADGDYFVRVYDHLLRGGPDFVYRVETEVAKPEILVTMPEFQQQDNQYRKAMEVPRGGRYAVVANVTRQNVRCDVRLGADNLPPGVVLKAAEMPAAVGQYPIVFEAAPDAPAGTRLVSLWAESTDSANPVRGVFTHPFDWVRGNPNNTVYYSTTVDVMPVAVLEEAPYSLELEPLGRALLRDGQAQMKVVAKRKEGFTTPITARWLWRPPGFSCDSTVTIPEGKTEALFNISANGNAELRTWKVCVLGESNTPKGVVCSASGLTDLEIADHFVTMKMNLTTVQQGGKGEILLDVEEVTGFNGDAKVRVLGLPAKATAEEAILKKGDTQVRIPMQTAPDTPVGQQKNVFCELVFNEGGKEYRQRAGLGGIVRVDPAPKVAQKPAAEPVKAAAPVAPAKAENKPLSRLEQLRVEAKKAAEAGK